MKKKGTKTINFKYRVIPGEFNPLWNHGSLIFAHFYIMESICNFMVNKKISQKISQKFRILRPFLQKWYFTVEKTSILSGRPLDK